MTPKHKSHDAKEAQGHKTWRGKFTLQEGTTGLLEQGEYTA